jgi:hypothetical protein
MDGRTWDSDLYTRLAHGREWKGEGGRGVVALVQRMSARPSDADRVRTATGVISGI